MHYAEASAENVYNYPLHTHGYYEIMYVVEGDGCLFTQNSRFPLLPGQIFIAPPNCAHGIESRICHRIINIGGSFERLSFIKELYVISDNEHREGGMLAEAIMRNIYNNQEYAHSLCKALIRFLLLNAVPSNDVHSTVYRIISSIDDRYDDCELDVGELLRQSGYAEDYVRSKFISITGQTPVKYLTAVRMKNAKVMLYSSSGRISEIAQRCGFVDTAYFSRVFKKSFGMSPKEYRDGVKPKIVPIDFSSK